MSLNRRTSTKTQKPLLKVAVGVIKNHKGDILISQRSDGVHQGGLWEFPGGKIEHGESTFQALKRELMEELGIIVQSAKPLLGIQHHYDDLSVYLDVCVVEEFDGKANGMEGQPVKWVAVPKLSQYTFPEANKKIIDTLNLSPYYPIVDDSLGDAKTMLTHLKRLIAGGYSMIQLRAKSLNKKKFKSLAKEAINISNKAHISLFLNTSLEVAIELDAKAVHLSTEQLGIAQMPLPKSVLVATSCHSQQELLNARKAGVLFAVLSPVLQTKTHINAKPLGWGCFEGMANNCPMPVYALGGLGPKDLDQATAKGAYGVSGIRTFVDETT